LRIKKIKVGESGLILECWPRARHNEFKLRCAHIALEGEARGNELLCIEVTAFLGAMGGGGGGIYIPPPKAC
jgi:hypothetical protein